MMNNEPRHQAEYDACGWRIVVSPMIPHDFPSCHNSSVPALAWLLLVRDGAGFPNLSSKSRHSSD
jgi:hypothetical protein